MGSQRYHVTIKTYFPVEIDTGIPLIGKVVIMRAVLIMGGDVDLSTNSVTNLNIESLSIG